MAGAERPLVGISGLVATVAAGDDRDSLEAIRDGLALALERALPNEVAPLSKQLVEVLALIRGLPVKEASAVDEIAAKRARRKARPSDAPTEGGQRRSGGDGPSS